MNIKLKRNTNFKIFLGILFFVLSFFFFYISEPTEAEAACYSHACCGSVGFGGCVWEPFSGSVSCNCQGTTLYCDRGDCQTCTPPGCPTGYTPTNTGCSTTTTSCTRYYCIGGACGSSERTCWKTKNTVAYDDNGGNCPADLSVCYGGAAAAPNCTRTYHTATSYTITAGSCASGWNPTTGYCGSVTTAMTIRPNWTINSYTINYDPKGADFCIRYNEVVNHGSASLGNSCSRDLYDFTGFSIKSGSCGGTFNSTTGVCSSVTGSMNVEANWTLSCQAPTAPTGLLINNTSSPAVIADTTPYFSAIFNDPDTNATSTQYQILVNTNNTFSGTTMWNSGLSSMPTTAQGQRTSNLNYGGSTLSLNGSTYYWKIRMTDNCGYISPYSAVAQFTMNRAPATPTSLQTEGATNPTCVLDATPEFTAIYSDPDGHSASKYQIQVNTNSSFTGTTMWDSGLTGGISTPSGSRTDPISYAGTPLTFNGTTYYWRIRFADEYGTVSPWSTTANFRMNIPRTVTYDANGGSCTPSSRVINCGGSAAGPSCSRTNYILTGFSITSGSCAGTFDSSTGYCSSVTTDMTIRANWILENFAPTTPTGLLINNTASPAVVADTTPYFSAIFNDPNSGDYSEQYQIQVNTNNTFTGTVMWDTGLTSMARTYQGQRTPNINYGGSTLSLDGSTYYWRIRMSDAALLTSPYSAVAQFTMNRAPATPTSLQTEGATNPTCVSDATPEFTAIYSDPDGHSASKYQIQVNTNSSFTGTTMWDSGLTGGISTPSGSRTDPISYAGTPLTFNGTTYYWRIRFADEYGTVSPWSATANFRMNIPPTAPTQPLTEGLVNPIDIGILDPTFSAIFNDPDTCPITEYSEHYEIEVNTSPGFTGSVMWDTGKTPMTRINKGSRSPEITYDGTALSLNGATYYWRIRFWDSVESVSPWSTTSSFTMEANQAPTAPTGLLVNGITNNPRVNDPNPKFSAIFNDPNQYDFSNYYEIEVNTNETFTGTVMWDSGQQFMSTTTQGARSPNITYNGLTLSLEGVTYYWRIRFWDAANAVSPWATGTFTTASSYATFQDIQFGGLIFEMP